MGRPNSQATNLAGRRPKSTSKMFSVLLGGCLLAPKDAIKVIMVTSDEHPSRMILGFLYTALMHTGF